MRRSEEYHPSREQKGHIKHFGQAEKGQGDSEVKTELGSNGAVRRGQ